MPTRRAARERALGLAYECEQRGVTRRRAARRSCRSPPDEYACRLVLGVDEHREEIDALIRKYSEHWSLERMPVIDRALLRLGTYELGWVPEVPTAVASSPKRSSSRSSTRRRTPGGSSTGCSRASPRTCARSA